MPIHCPISITSLSPHEFEMLDYRVMGHAYASHNDLGRLCDECAYQADLKARLSADGFQSVFSETPVTVTHDEFSKRYFLDLIAGNGVYELKADSQLVSEHEKQLLNYMFLLGIQRAKLLNFRGSRVQGKIIATSLDQETRRCFQTLTDRWDALTPACCLLRERLCDLLRDWGAFLEINLYQEALIHFLGGQTAIEQPVSLIRNGIALTKQKMFICAPGIAFRVTAVTEDQQHVESHLRRLLNLTNLRVIQWINLNHARIEFTTIHSNAKK